MHRGGAAEAQRERVIALVLAHPGRTSKELSALCGDLDRQLARPR